MITTRVMIAMADGTEAMAECPMRPDGTYPAAIASEGREFVLGRRPGVVENVMALSADGEVGPASTMAWYIESEGVDATCLDCKARIRVEKTEEADDLLELCRSRGHTVMLLYVHLDDANVIEWLNRTVGDVREQCDWVLK